MSVLLLFRKLVFAQVLLSLVAFCFAEQRPELLLAAGALCALSWYVVEGPNGKPLPAWMIMTGAVIASVWLLSSLYFRDANIIAAVGHFTIWLQILLLYGPKTNREYGEILALSLLTMMGASLLTVSMLFALLLTVYCVLGLVTLLVFYLKNSNDHVTRARRVAAPGHESVERPAAVVGMHHRRQFRFMAVLVGVSCIVVASLVFLLFPRSQQNDWQVANLNPFRRTQAGFSARVDLTGPAPSASGTRAAVMHLNVYRDGEAVTGAAEETFLLRGAALDHYDPNLRVWSRTIGDYGETYTPLDGGVATLDEAAADVPSHELRIALRHPSTSTLFSLYPTSRIESDDFDAVSLHPVDQQLSISGQPPSGTVTYRVRSPIDAAAARPSPDTERRVYPRGDGERRVYPRGEGIRAGPDADPDAGVEVERYASTWPVDTDRISRYTRDVIDQSGLRGLAREDELRVAEAIADHLRRTYRYSLGNPSIERGRDPVSAFLFDHRQGHCELFAAAMVAMTRSVGIRSRVVTGYHVSEYNRVGGYFVVRENDAHAWAEVRDKTGRWYTFDATAPEAVAAEHRADVSVLGMIRELYEHLEYAWIDSFAAFNAEARGHVLQRGMQWVRDLFDGFGQVIRRWLDWWSNWRWHASLDWLDFVLAGGLFTVLVVASYGMVRVRRRRRRHAMILHMTTLPHRDRHALLDSLSFYVRALEMLGAHGYARPPWQTPGAFVHSLKAQAPEAAGAMEELTGLFYELRYGARANDAARRDRAAKAIANLEAALR